jgi:hypothetical protein
MLHYDVADFLFLQLLCHIRLWPLDTPKRFGLFQSCAPTISKVDEGIKHLKKFLRSIETKGIVAIG